MCEVENWTMLLALMTVSISDIRKKEIPVVSLILMSVSLLILRIFVLNTTWEATSGGIVVGVLFFAISRLTREAIGYGDSWVILFLGICLGGVVTIQILFWASFMTSVFSIIKCIRHGWNRKQTLPFLPFLTVAYIGVVML